jgi:hypothetical protein
MSEKCQEATSRALEMKEAANWGGLFLVREIGDYQRRP